jgi:molybdopterin-containing oxidoreductase family iron-sulfur binding subunit
MKLTRKEFLRLSGACLVAAPGRKLLAALDTAARKATAAGEVRPRPHWGMLIDTRKCLADRDCIKCTEACDAAHNIPAFDNPAHEVTWIWKEPFASVFPEQQTAYAQSGLKDMPTPVLCNHCDNPPCARVCPTAATWKREDGIVMMDWHLCIGCRYCMAACPYGSRSFNWVDPRSRLAHLNPDFPTRTMGVVEKCTFCPERLAKGRAPACVEACSARAIVFGDLSDPHSEARQLLGSRFAVRRRPEMGTGPNVYYLI